MARAIAVGRDPLQLVAVRTELAARPIGQESRVRQPKEPVEVDEGKEGRVWPAAEANRCQAYANRDDSQDSQQNQCGHSISSRNDYLCANRLSVYTGYCSLSSSDRESAVAPRGGLPSQQEAGSPGVSLNMAVPNVGTDEAPRAQVRLPTEWLMPLTTLELVRDAQRPDTHANLTSEWLTMLGIEIVIDRSWIREPFWSQIKDAIAGGFIYKKSAAHLVVRGDRRTGSRPRG